MTKKLRLPAIAMGILTLLVGVAFYQMIDHEFVIYDDPRYVVENPHVQAGITLAGLRWACTEVYASNWHPLTWFSHMLDCQLWGLQPGSHHLTNGVLHLLNGCLLFYGLWRLTNRSAAFATAEDSDHPRAKHRSEKSGNKDRTPKTKTKTKTKTKSESKAKAKAKQESVPKAVSKSLARDPESNADVWTVQARWMACALVAALFVIHPLHVESVAWVSERKDTLSTLFWLLTIVAYERYARVQTRCSYALVCLALGLGLCAKQMLVTLPLVLLMLDVWPLGRLSRAGRPSRVTGIWSRWRPLAWEKIPLFVLSGTAAVVIFVAQRSGGATADLNAVPYSYRLANAVLSYTGYLIKTVWPVGLSCFYPHPYEDPTAAPSSALVLLAALALVAVTLAAWRFGARRLWLRVGWLWYLITLLPVVGLVQIGDQGMADRYTYVPLIGIFIAVAFELVVRSLHWKRAWRVATWATAWIVVAALTGLTWRQVGYWRDSVTLFTQAVEVTRPSPITRNYLARALFSQGRIADAEQRAREAVSLNRAYAPAQHALAVILIAAEKPYEAQLPLGVTMRLMPEDVAWAPTASNLAWMLATHQESRLRDGRMAVELATQAVNQAQRHHALHFNYLDTLAAAYAEQGDFTAAEKYAAVALEAARKSAPEEQVERIARHLEHYRQRQPWRE